MDSLRRAPIALLLGVIMAFAMACSAESPIGETTFESGDPVTGADSGSAGDALDDAAAAVTDSDSAGDALSDPTDPADARDAADDRSRADATFGTVLPAPKVLPPTFSTITAAGPHGFYYAATRDDLRLIAFDRSTGEGAFQIAAHPLGRIRGVSQGVVASELHGLVYVTGIDDPTDESTAYLAAHNATSGEAVWRSTISYRSAQPSLCGEDVCVRESDRQLVFDGATGDLVRSFPSDGRAVLIANETLWLTFAEIDGQTAIAATEPVGAAVQWAHLLDDLEAFVELDLEPDFGWRGDHDAESGAVILWLATGDGTGLVAIGIDAEGQLQWSRADLDPCVESPVVLDVPITCVVDLEANVYTQIIRLDLATGEPVWSVPLDTNHEEFVYDGSELFAWQWFGDSYDLHSVDVDTGALRDDSGEPALCLYVTEWVEFAYPDGVFAPWASSPNHAMCGPDGFYLERDAALAAATQLEPGGEPFWIVDAQGVPLVEVD